MLSNFRSYQLALKLYQACKLVRLSPALKDQLLRASSSICLNLSEGSARSTPKDRAKFYCIAFGSLREVQAVMELEPEAFLPEQKDLSNHLGACLYKLTRA